MTTILVLVKDFNWVLDFYKPDALGALMGFLEFSSTDCD